MEELMSDLCFLWQYNLYLLAICSGRIWLFWKLLIVLIRSYLQQSKAMGNNGINGELLRQLQIRNASLRIFANFMQTLSILSHLNFEWPKEVQFQLNFLGLLFISLLQRVTWLRRLCLLTGRVSLLIALLSLVRKVP